MISDIHVKAASFIRTFLEKDVTYFSLLIFFGFIVLLQSPLSLFSSSYPGVDSSVFLYIGKALSAGQVPYLDVFDHKGPLLYLINYLGTSLGNFHGVWFVEFIFLSITLVFSYKTVRLISDKIPAFFSVMAVFSLLFLYFEQGNLVEEYSLPFIVISLYLLTKSLVNKKDLSNTALAVVGFCCGAVLLLRPNMIAVWVAFCLVIFLNKLINREYKIAVNYILFFMLGLSIIFVPTLLYFQIHSSLTNLIDTYLLFNLKYAKAMPGDRWGATKVFSNNMFLQVSLIFLVISSTLKRHNKEEYNVLYLALFIFIFISFVSVIMSGMSYYHYGMVLIPCYLLPMGFFANYLYHNYKNLVEDQILQFVVFALAYVIIFNNSLLILKKNIEATRTIGNNHNLLDLIRNNSNEGDKISVTGNMVGLYLYSGRDSASKYIYQDPISYVDPLIPKNYVEDIIRLKPALIISSIQVSGPSYSAPYASGLQEVLLDKYYSVGVSDGFTVYKRVESNR